MRDFFTFSGVFAYSVLVFCGGLVAGWWLAWNDRDRREIRELSRRVKPEAGKETRWEPSKN